MAFVIDTYQVTFPLGDEQVTWRVSESDLEAFYKILRWNGVKEYRTEVEVL